MKRFLALDIGDKRTGIALVDDQNRVATPLETISASLQSSDFLKRLSELIEEWEPELLIFGLPVDLKGKESIAASNMREKVADIMAALSKKFEESDLRGIGHVFVDERMTSAQADKLLLQGDLGSKSRKNHRDALAAALIAQSWVDSL